MGDHALTSGGFAQPRRRIGRKPRDLLSTRTLPSIGERERPDDMARADLGVRIRADRHRRHARTVSSRDSVQSSSGRTGAVHVPG